MNTTKSIGIQGAIELPINCDIDKFIDDFIDLVESNNGTFFGGFDYEK